MKSFDKVIDRRHQFAAKYDELEMKFGKSDLIPLWVADMDFLVAHPIAEAIEKRGKDHMYGYTSRPDSYFESVINWYTRRYGFKIAKQDLIHSPGVVTSLNVIIRELTNSGDKIIIQPPVYPPFYDAVIQNQRVLLENPLIKYANEYVMNYEELEELAKEASMLILCNPHNPVGRVWRKEELQRMGEICARNKVRIISDEIHGDLVFGKNMYTPMATLSQEARELTITCFSATKTFNIAGLQSSFIHAPNKEDYEKIDKFFSLLDLKRNNCFSLVAVEAAFSMGEDWLESMLDYVMQNMTYVRQFCDERIPELKPNLPEGTYLQWVDCKDLDLTDEELNEFMINDAKIALNLGSLFGVSGTGYVRLNLACPRKMVEEAMFNLEEAVKKLRTKKEVTI